MRHKIKNFINSYVVSQESKNEFELKIRNFISENLNNKTFRFIQLILFVGLIIIARYFYIFVAELRFLFFIVVGIVVLVFVWMNNLKRNQRKNVNLLYRAINEIRYKNYQKALDYLLLVHSRIHDDELWLLILEFSEKYKPTPDQQSKLNIFMMEEDKDLQKKDSKLFEILKQIKLVADYIFKHKQVISQSKTKILDLNRQLLKTKDLKLQNEYNKLINRYDNIIELENSKINFYQKAQNELLKLKENHIVTQKLLSEQNELQGLENSLLEKSIQEAYETDMNVDEFISYESSYIEALKEYSETLSNTSDQNLFNDVIRKFKDKTELL